MLSHITGMDVELPGGQLGLLREMRVIRFHIHGSLVSAKAWMAPSHRKVHISQRFVQGANGEQAGEIALTPVVEVTEDAAYVGRASVCGPADWRNGKHVSMGSESLPYSLWPD